MPDLPGVHLLRPGEEGYDERRAGFQLARPHRPELVAAPASAEQAAAVIASARRAGLPLAVQSTGHGRTEPTEGGVLLDTRRLDAVHVDPGTRTAWIGAGVTWRDVLAAAVPHGLATPSGSAPTVGAVGYTLGGGLGLLGRRHGWAADLVRRMDVVTAEGEVLRTTAAHHPELFWALRGGGAGLATVVGMELELPPVARVWGGRLVFGEREVPRVVAAYPAWAEGLPEGLSSSLALAVHPDLPAFPAELRGRYTAQVRIVWDGTAEAGERLVAPLRRLGEVLADTLGSLPFAEAHTVYRDPETPHAYDGDCALLDAVEPAELQAVAERGGPTAPVPCILQLNHLGGALAAAPSVPNAVGHRSARFLLRVLSPLAADGHAGCSADVAHDAETAAVRAQHAHVLDAVAARTLGRNPAFVFGPHPADQDRPTHEPALAERLARVRLACGID